MYLAMHEHKNPNPFQRNHIELKLGQNKKQKQNYKRYLKH